MVQVTKSELGKKYSDEYSQLKRDYSFGVKDIPSKIPNFEDLKSEVQREKQRNAFNDFKTRYMRKLNAFNEKLDSDIQRLEKSKFDIKFPSLSSEDPQSKLFGSSEISNAYSLLNTKYKPNDLLKIIEEAKVLKRHDFLSALQSQLSTLAERYVGTKDPNSAFNHEVITSIKDAFSETELAQVELELNDLVSLKKSVVMFTNGMGVDNPNKGMTFENWEKNFVKAMN